MARDAVLYAHSFQPQGAESAPSMTDETSTSLVQQKFLYLNVV